MEDSDKKGMFNKSKDIDNNFLQDATNVKHFSTEQVFLDQNQKEIVWEYRDSPDFLKESIQLPMLNSKRISSIQQNQEENLKTSTSQILYSEVNLMQKLQISQEFQGEEQQNHNQGQQHNILQKQKPEVPTFKKKNQNHNFQTITEISSCVNNNSLLNNDLISPKSQFIQSQEQIVTQKPYSQLQSPPLNYNENSDQLNLLQLQSNQNVRSKEQQVEGDRGSQDDLVSSKSSRKSDKKRTKNFSEVPNSYRGLNNQHNENTNGQKEDKKQMVFIHKQKTLTEKFIDKIVDYVNGSQIQAFANEDKHLQEQQNEFEKRTQAEFNQNTKKSRKSIRLFNTKFHKNVQIMEHDQIQSPLDFDEFMSKSKNENHGVKRRTYTELNSLMKQQTGEYDFQNKYQDQVQEDDDEGDANDGKSDIDSLNGSNQIAQTEEERQKTLNKHSKIKKIKKNYVRDENGALKVELQEEKKYDDYPFPYNQKSKQKEDEAYRNVEEYLKDLKEEYEYYSKKQILKQEKNREIMIYAAKKNEFEMLTVMADSYPLLQVRKGILLIFRLLSWIAYRIIKHRYFERIVLFVIIFNTVMQCMDDPTSDEATPVQDGINTFFLIAYTIECVLKIFGLGFVLNKGSYLRDGWNILDFTIVVTSLLPYVIGSSSGVNLSSLRSLRVLRPLKTISKIRSLKIVLLALFSSFPYLVNAIIILFFFYLIFAIAGVQLFMGLLKRRCYNPETGVILLGATDQPCGGQRDCPSGYVCGKMFDNPIYGVYNFDNILSSFLMVFICVTLESWTQIMYYVFDSFSILTVIYFVFLAFVGAFFLINLTLAVIKAKFTKPEDMPDDADKVEIMEEPIDMYRLKMFRRMERNHLRRKLLAKKQILMVGAQDVEVSDDGLYFNWEDLMKLKMKQDQEDQKLAQQEQNEQKIEKQIIMKEKLKQKLKKAITKDTLFKKYKLETSKERQLPNQKIVFYVGKEQGEVISQATLNEIEHPHHHHHKKRESRRLSSRNIDSKVFGLHDRSHNQKQTKLGRQSSIQLQGEFQERVKQSKKEMQQIAFLGVQRGVIPSQKIQPKQDRKKSQFIPIETLQNLNQKIHHPHSHRQTQVISATNSHVMKDKDPNHLVNEEDDQKIFERFDEINRLEQEEYKKYEKENGRVDMDEFTVINNKNLKRLKRLPDVQTQLSILTLKRPKILNNNDVPIKKVNKFKNLKQIITEEDFKQISPYKGNESPFQGMTSPITRDENAETSDQISKQITKSSLKSNPENIEQDKECFANLNQKLQQIHEQKQQNSSILQTMGPLTTDTPLNNKIQNELDLNLVEQQEITFQDMGNLKTTQNDEIQDENLLQKDKIQQNNLQKLLLNDEEDSGKSLGIIDHESVDEEENNKQNKFSSQSMKRGSFSKKSPTQTPKKSPTQTPNTKRSQYNGRKKGTYDDYYFQYPTDENKDEQMKKRDSFAKRVSIAGIYNDEEDEDDEDIWVEENIPVKPSTILKNISNHQRKNNDENEVEGEEHQQQVEKQKNIEQRRSSKLNAFGRLNSILQIQLGKKKDDEDENKKQNSHNEHQARHSIQSSIAETNDYLTFGQTALKTTQKKIAQKRQSRASIHHVHHNIDHQAIQRQSIMQHNGLQRQSSNVKNQQQKKLSTIKPQNVRHWKIMIDMKKEYKSNSSSDVLFHRLKADQDNKIEEEQVKIRNMKYILNYRLRTIKKLNKKLLQRMKREKKKKQKALKSRKLLKSLNKSTPTSKQKASVSGDISDSNSTHNRSNSFFDTTDLNFFQTQNDLINKNIRLPIRKNTIQDQLSSSAQETINEIDDQSIGSYIMKNVSQMNSFTARNQNLLRARMRSRQAKQAQAKDKIANVNYETISKLVQENIIRPQIKTSLDSITNKAVYWDIRRIDFNLGIKNMNIWSGQNVNKSHKSRKHTNKVLKQLCTENQDLHVWVPRFKGLVSVLHKHYKNFILGNIFNGMSMLCVFLNTAVLAMNGSFQDQAMNDLLTSANEAFSIIFIVEMGLKIFAFGPLGYVRDKINLFDGLIVSISIVEMAVFSGGSKAVSAFRAVRIFRTFRVLRVTRLLRGLEFMATIMSVINRTIDSFMYIALLLFLFIFIYSLLGMQIYGGQLNFDDNGGIRQNYDSFFYSFLCTFQIVTLENWTDILIKTMRSTVHPAITSLYLISWIFIGNYVFLNLFLAILLDGFVAEGDEEEMHRDMMQLEEEGGDDSDIDEQIQTNILKMNKKQIREEKKKLSLEQEFLLDIKQQQEQFEIDSQTNLEVLFEDKKVAKVKLFHKIECRDSLFMFSKQNKFRILCYRIAQSHRFENFILFLIISSSLKLVADTYLDENDQNAQDISENIDIAFNSIFTLESFIKIIAYGLFGDENSYLTDTWSQLDFFIVLASLLDMSVASINLPVIKVLRLLRTLRPLRFISHNVNMKVVVIALFESVGAIANVLVVVLLIWYFSLYDILFIYLTLKMYKRVMFAILGMSLIGDRMGYCAVDDYYGINYDTVIYLFYSFNISLNLFQVFFIILISLLFYKCMMMGKTWKVFNTNFDNITNSMTTLLILSTLENWPNMMFQAQDSDTQDAGPKFMNYSIISFFYIFFILVGSFFLINLFIGVIFLKFTEAQKSQKTSIFLTDKQARWIEFQMMIIGVKAQFSQNKKPENKFRLIFWKLVNFQAFDISIMLCIVANIITMGLQYEGQSIAWSLNLQYVNYFFTAVFISEMIFKILSTGFSVYLTNSWNKFDFFVVCSSIVDISMDLMGGQSLSFLRVGPQLARVVRVFRVTRLLKLVKSMRGLQKLIETLVFSLPSLVNVGALMLLFFFIFSVLGVFLFQDIVKGDYITSYNNFQNFGNAMITLFRCSTGENWQYIMFDVENQHNCKPGGTCYTSFARIYFVFFILVCVFVMLNLFILVLIQYFEDYHMKEDNPLDAFNENLEVFRSVWAKYTDFSSGIKIKNKQIVNFLSELPIPLGYYEKIEDVDDRIDKHQIAKDVMEMKLADDGQGCVFFNDCLFACMKKAYGAELVNDGAIELKKFLIKQEYETKKKIEEKKRQLLIKQKQKIFNNINNKHVNPIVLMLFCGMAFKSWKKYEMRVEQGEIIKGESESSSESSCQEDEDKQEDGDQREQEFDENGNPIERSDDSQSEEDSEEQDSEKEKNGKQVDSRRQSHDLEDIYEKEEEEEDEDENAKVKNQDQEQKQKDKNQTKQKEQQLSLKKIPTLLQKRQESLNNNKQFDKISNKNEQELNKMFEKQQSLKIQTQMSSLFNKKQQKKNKSSSSSDEESEKEEVIERAGYDENEDFVQLQEKNKQWKEKELKMGIKQNMLNDDDKDQGHSFLKTPKYFKEDEDDDAPFDEVDTPAHFRQKSKKKRQNGKNKKQQNY